MTVTRLPTPALTSLYWRLAHLLDSSRGNVALCRRAARIRKRLALEIVARVDMARVL